MQLNPCLHPCLHPVPAATPLHPFRAPAPPRPQGYTVVGLDIAPQQEPDVDIAPQPHSITQQQQEQQQQRGRVGRYTYVGGCDVRRADHLRGLLLPAVQRAVEEGGCGGLNLLVNNAGVANPYMGAVGAAAGAVGEGGGEGGQEDGAVEAWRTFIDTNLTGGEAGGSRRGRSSGGPAHGVAALTDVRQSDGRRLCAWGVQPYTAAWHASDPRYLSPHAFSLLP